MFHDDLPNLGEDLRRGVLFAPLAIEYQFVVRAKKKVDVDLPLATALRVKMRRQMVRGVEPEIQTFQDRASTLPTRTSASFDLPSNSIHSTGHLDDHQRPRTVRSRMPDTAPRHYLYFENVAIECRFRAGNERSGSVGCTAG